jgi:hypothetical protein
MFFILTRYSILWIRNHHSSSANLCGGLRCERPKIVFGTLDVRFGICKYYPRVRDGDFQTHQRISRVLGPYFLALCRKSRQLDEMSRTSFRLRSS